MKEGAGTKACSIKTVAGKSYACPVELTLQVIGGKWKPIILYYLGENEVMRFGELKKAMPTITQKMLTRQLRELENDGVVRRVVYAQVPPRVEYSLTRLGSGIIPVLHELCRFGREYEEMLLDGRVGTGMPTGS